MYFLTSVACALYQERDLMILDEATNALDEETEKKKDGKKVQSINKAMQ